MSKWTDKSYAGENSRGKTHSGIYSGLKGQNTNQCRNTYYFNVSIIFLIQLWHYKSQYSRDWIKYCIKTQKKSTMFSQHSSPNGIMFLQETHSTEEVEAIWTNPWGCGKGAIHFLPGKSDSRGVLTGFREGLDYKMDSVFYDNDGQYQERMTFSPDNTLSFKQRFRKNHSF